MYGVTVYGQVIEVFGTNSGNHMVHVQHLAERAIVDNNFYKVCFLLENLSMVKIINLGGNVIFSAVTEVISLILFGEDFSGLWESIL